MHIFWAERLEYKGINLLLYKWQNGGGVEQSAAIAATAPNRPLLLRLIDFVNNCSCHFPPQDNCVCAQISLLTFLSQHFVQALKFDLNKHKSANNTKRQMTVSLILSKTILTLLSKVTIVWNFLMCWATEDVEKWTRKLPQTRLGYLKLNFFYKSI